MNAQRRGKRALDEQSESKKCVAQCSALQIVHYTCTPSRKEPPQSHAAALVLLMRRRQGAAGHDGGAGEKAGRAGLLRLTAAGAPDSVRLCDVQTLLCWECVGVWLGMCWNLLGMIPYRRYFVACGTKRIAIYKINCWWNPWQAHRRPAHTHTERVPQSGEACLDAASVDLDLGALMGRADQYPHTSVTHVVI